MGIFFEKPTKGPDVTGGAIWPIKETARMWNRTGRTVSKGEIVQVALTPGEASEAATNDANTYIPGASNDTVWNTIIDPISNTGLGSSIQRGGIWGVCLDDSVADNATGDFQFFGVVAESYVVSSNTVNPGDPLTVYASNAAIRLASFDNVIKSNEVVIATYLAPTDASITTRELKRVFLHQGLFYQMSGANGGLS